MSVGRVSSGQGLGFRPELRRRRTKRPNRYTNMFFGNRADVVKRDGYVARDRMSVRFFFFFRKRTNSFSCWTKRGVCLRLARVYGRNATGNGFRNVTQTLKLSGVYLLRSRNARTIIDGRP